MQSNVSLLILLIPFVGFSQIEKLSGPRIGLTFITQGSSADYLNEGIAFDEDENDGFEILGQHLQPNTGGNGKLDLQIVMKILLELSNGLHLGIKKGVLTIGIFISGIRTVKGFECALGPNVSLSGVGLAFAVGYNFKSGNLNIPINLAFIPGINKNGNYRDNNNNSIDYNYSTGNRISLLIGFNMNKKNK